MITQTFKMQFQCVMWITRHSSIWISSNSIHCSLPSQLRNLQKVGHDIVIFIGNVLGHAWHTWCKKGINGKKMSCSSLICHTHIFKSIDFRTMGLWIWITFFLYALYYIYVIKFTIQIISTKRSCLKTVQPYSSKVSLWIQGISSCWKVYRHYKKVFCNLSLISLICPCVFPLLFSQSS